MLRARTSLAFLAARANFVARPPQLPKMDSPTSVKDIFSNLQIYKFSS